eukprot:Tamp_10077.p1 GENE.Tamp_10077~~Tamp_10077.p1  ORF type:complete len:261 (+),score=58.83 Tamp_10077:213-995(+)
MRGGWCAGHLRGIRIPSSAALAPAQQMRWRQPLWARSAPVMPLFLLHAGVRGIAAASQEQLERVTLQVPGAAAGTVVAVSLGDLTKWRGDAIVNAANERCLGGGGVDGAIHRAAGPRLLDECRALPEKRPGVRCPTGEAVITGGHDLAAKFIIHTVGPNLSGRDDVGAAASDDTLLAAAYQSSLRLANERGLKSIAFPAISCGVFAFPLPAAARVAMLTAEEEAGGLELVEFVLFSADTYAAFAAAAREQFGGQPSCEKT